MFPALGLGTACLNFHTPVIREKVVALSKRKIRGAESHITGAGGKDSAGAARIAGGGNHDGNQRHSARSIPALLMAEILPWSESFAVGHDGLDLEHRHLVKLINEIGTVVRSKKNPEKLVDLVKVLHWAAVEHIRHENAILWQIQTGNYKPLQKRSQSQRFLKIMAKAVFDEHMAEHDALLARLATIVSGPASTLCDDLKAWFVEHVHGYEADLKAIFQAAA